MHFYSLLNPIVLRSPTTHPATYYCIAYMSETFHTDTGPPTAVHFLDILPKPIFPVSFHTFFLITAMTMISHYPGFSPPVVLCSTTSLALPWQSSHTTRQAVPQQSNIDRAAGTNRAVGTVALAT